LTQKLSMDLVLKKSRSPIYLQSAQRLSNSPKLILDSSDVVPEAFYLVGCGYRTVTASR